MALGSMDMNILPWEVVVESSIHLVVENFHLLEVVHLGNNMEGWLLKILMLESWWLYMWFIWLIWLLVGWI